MASCSPRIAHAEGENNLFGAGEAGEAPLTAYELQQNIESTQAEYAAAQTEAEDASARVTEQLERIEKLEKEIPIQIERSNQATRELYKIQQQSVSILTMLLTSGSLQNFITQIEYVSRITDANLAEIQRLTQLRDELAEERDALQKTLTEAEERAEEARLSLETAQAIQAEEQRRIEEEARIAAEAAANVEALEETPRQNDTTETPSTSEQEEPSGEETNGDESNLASAPSPVDPPSSTDIDTFVNTWAPRINAYLAGSPMANQGETFARAAYTYNVDPRWSPAIACTESGKGAYCFLPYNAWGWGSCSWDSWEDAINDHVAGLASIYGFTISVDAAKTYCPPNWEFWYNTTASQMNLI